MNPTGSRWKSALFGCLFAAIGVVAALMVYLYPNTTVEVPWVVYGLCGAFVFVGAGAVAYSLKMRKAAVALASTGVVALAAAEAREALDRGLGECVRSISGIAVLEPALVCRGAFAVLAVGAALVLTSVILGYLGRKNGA